MEFAKVIGTKISDIRNLKHLSREQLADKAGISVEGLGKIERGESIPQSYTMVKIALALEMDIEEIVSFKPSIHVNNNSNYQGNNNHYAYNNDSVIKELKEQINVLDARITSFENGNGGEKHGDGGSSHN